jgi:hypothetical protein
MVITVGNVKGPPGPGYENALILEEKVTQLEIDSEAHSEQFTQVSSELNKIIPLAQKGVNNGVASLDDTGKVPASQLPSYVDDVVEYTNFASFPLEGEAGKIYVAKNTNKTYRWSGTAYTIIGGDIALGETSSTAYAGDKGKANAEAIVTLQQSNDEIGSALSQAVQTISALNNIKLDVTEKAQPNGVASLDNTGKVPQNQLPALSASNINAFGFEVRSDGHLWMVAQDDTSLPDAWISSDGHLHIRFNDPQ